MANLKVSEQAYPSTRYTEAAAPATPAAGEVIIYAKADGNLYQKDDAGTETALAGAAGSVATDAIWDAKGDLAAGTGANTASKLTVGANDTVLMADSGQSTGLKWVASQTPSTQAFGDSAAEGTADTYARGDHKHAMPADPGAAYAPPRLTNQAGNYASTGTSLATTMTAPTAGDNLVGLVFSTGRGCNSITQTNVVWTQRYTGNGNSQYFEIWTGVVSASAGTTATFAFTGSNKQQIETFVVAGAGNWTSGTIQGSSATSSSATLLTNSAALTTAGDYVILGISRNSPASSYTAMSQAYTPTSTGVFGGAGTAEVFRAGANLFASMFSIASSSVQQFTAFVKMS